MKAWKTVSGIISIVCFGFVAFQSCSAGMVEEYTKSKTVSGGAGLIVSIIMLVGGIISISTRSSAEGKGNTFLFLTYGIGAMIGFSQDTFFKDLKIWAGWCLINSIVALAADIYIFVNKYKQPSTQQQYQQPPQQSQQMPPQQRPSHHPYPQTPPQMPVKQNNDSVNNIEMIKKYKELLDMGAITQEEFDKKKQELL